MKSYVFCHYLALKFSPRHLSLLIYFAQKSIPFLCCHSFHRDENFFSTRILGRARGYLLEKNIKTYLANFGAAEKRFALENKELARINFVGNL